MSGANAPLTLGTAGHVDHGKTALVAALTGVDTDRLPEERARGMSIELGYAPLMLPSGRRLSVIDVPGHERFVRTMVAGAAGIDLFLMTIAADDGVMPQTREHAAVLAALGVRRGVVAVTKADLVDPAPARAEAAELLPGVEVMPCSARSGAGVAGVAAAVDRVADNLTSRADIQRPSVLHIDRAFTVHGVGTVITGTLWSGAVTRGDELVCLPLGLEVRVRGVQVHDVRVERARAGQRVALNLAGVSVHELSRGDAVVGRGAAIEPTLILDAALELAGAHDRQRVQIHHGTRHAPARLVALGGHYWQIRLERPLLAAASDRLVVRSVAPPDTLGGGTIVDPRARRHGRRADLLARLERLEHGKPELLPPPHDPLYIQPASSPATPELGPAALVLAAQLLAAVHEPPTGAELGDAATHLPTLRAAGLAIRVGRDMHAHPDVLAAVRNRVVVIIEAEGDITLARLRDELKTSRKYAAALLEHLDAARVTRRLPDDRRVLRRRP
ncbi:MAG: selenocysteine-specific translation elongation factor [Solirubrobacterales bacterium]|nr:selenocysteine-specific translation elongation factor [Solirubrobacterales bacterium]